MNGYAGFYHPVCPVRGIAAQSLLSFSSKKLYTGDVAYEDEQGYFHIVDRKKDMINPGGFNIYPQELEQVLSRHTEVATVAVIGVPDPKWGEAVKAFVVLKSGYSVDSAELISLVKEKKGPVMAPKTVAFLNHLPLTELGKIDKKALRAPFWKNHNKGIH